LDLPKGLLESDEEEDEFGIEVLTSFCYATSPSDHFVFREGWAAGGVVGPQISENAMEMEGQKLGGLHFGNALGACRHSARTMCT
jgi:hypothetical protein